MENTKNYGVWIIGLVLLAFSAIFFFSAQNFSKQGSYVEVKGLSEKIVKADVAIWSINFEVKSNNVDSLYADIEKNVTTIKTFLKEKGFEESEINVAPVNTYQDTYKEALFRYNSTTQLSLYTKKVDLVKSASKDTLVLVKQGIVMNQNSVSFEFSDINSIKPEMLAEALKNARDTAQRIAQESGSSLGGLHRGNQGVFDISDKDPGSPEYKKIRLVSTLSFLIR
ncbi:SIMPL domain-containing protein [Candidatus Nomurabacteria bacterium CG22_combo_CG10-13_8_21_14_all_32_8]|uniref:SIMPL domain-containing protein n=2 Tax=Candidatus Nomuraibacteriota TaxID=1752729 RepID=A0A2H0CGQ4_9BACT|nr:MAG: SIMPL domain-containing protein [Candidatus Nomurabacteria bacterium CG22_combo_CG10-13_8_21_14_all_32_8]PIZ85845.1 MAG: SIMPL domain-containing protein [Candidatus Nomurabacteria bacterium CG_4_10_14_0_2_um_filter_33_9]